MKLFEAVQKTAQQLEPIYKSRDLSTAIALQIIESILKQTKLYVITHSEIALTQEQNKQLENWIHKITFEHIPVQYLIGSVPFADITIHIAPPTLIPRPETEEWCMNLISQLKTLPPQQLTILDLATGSGCIGLALAHALPFATVYASDISETALALAEKNAAHNNIKNIHFIHSDLFSTLPKNITYDIIVSNPPYIPESCWESLEKSVSLWEDKNALIASENGLALIRKIIKQAPAFLKENSNLTKNGIAQLIIEIDNSHGKDVLEIMNESKFCNTIITKDYNGNDRTVSGTL